MRIERKFRIDNIKTPSTFITTYKISINAKTLNCKHSINKKFNNFYIKINYKFINIINTKVLKIINSIIQKNIKSRLIQNATALALVQCLGYIISFITLPYLTRTLGPEEWGQVVWMEVMLGYFYILTDWGFNWTGVRKISSLRNNRDSLSECFISGLSVQIALCLFSVIIVLILNEYALFYFKFKKFTFYACICIITNIFFPSWLLSGLELIREVAIINLSIRLLSIPPIFIFVLNPNHGHYVLASTAFSKTILGIIVIYWINKKSIIKWKLPKINSIKNEFLEHSTIFLSRVAIVSYSNAIPTILGILSGPVAVAHYVLADKICTSTKSLIVPLSQSLFPRMSFLFSHNKKSAINLLLKSGTIILTISFFASVTLFMYAENIIYFISGKGYNESVMILKILSPLPTIIATSNVIGLQFMIPNQMTKNFTTIYVIAATLSFSIIFYFIKQYQAIGAALNILIVEAVVALMMLGSIITTKTK